MSISTVTPRDNIAAGIGWMLLTTFWFIGLDTLAKYLLQSYPAPQVLWARFLFHLVMAVVIMGPGVWADVRSARLGLQLARSVLLVLTTFLFFIGLSTVPLATATSIMFLTPLIVTVLSIPLLGERVGARRITGVLVGFAGAVVIVRPGFDAGSIGVLALLGASVANALYQLVTRQVRHYDGASTTLFYTALGGTIVFSAMAPMDWRTPDAVGWLLLVGVGVLGGVSQLCLIRAFRLAPAAVVSPFSYTGLVWAVAFGFLVFFELPDLWTLLGAILIIGSGLYVFHRERTLAVPVSHPVER